MKVRRVFFLWKGDVSHGKRDYVSYWRSYSLLLKIWGWYLVPGFNAPELTTATAVGVKLIANSLTSVGSNKSDYGFIELVCLEYLSNVCLLAIAYILLLFV